MTRQHQGNTCNQSEKGSGQRGRVRPEWFKESQEVVQYVLLGAHFGQGDLVLRRLET